MTATERDVLKIGMLKRVVDLCNALVIPPLHLRILRRYSHLHGVIQSDREARAYNKALMDVADACALTINRLSVKKKGRRMAANTKGKKNRRNRGANAYHSN